MLRRGKFPNTTLRQQVHSRNNNNKSRARTRENLPRSWSWSSARARTRRRLHTMVCACVRAAATEKNTKRARGRLPPLTACAPRNRSRSVVIGGGGGGSNSRSVSTVVYYPPGTAVSCVVASSYTHPHSPSARTPVPSFRLLSVFGGVSSSHPSAVRKSFTFCRCKPFRAKTSLRVQYANISYAPRIIVQVKRVHAVVNYDDDDLAQSTEKKKKKKTVEVNLQVNTRTDYRVVKTLFDKLWPGSSRCRENVLC